MEDKKPWDDPLLKQKWAREIQMYAIKSDKNTWRSNYRWVRYSLITFKSMDLKSFKFTEYYYLPLQSRLIYKSNSVTGF
jgi:hypothetical protein